MIRPKGAVKVKILFYEKWAVVPNKGRATQKKPSSDFGLYFDFSFYFVKFSLKNT
jgi:hypothetical protein